MPSSTPQPSKLNFHLELVISTNAYLASAILLEQCRQTLATKCADPEECERELSVARAILQEKAFAAAIPALCSVLQADDDYSDSSTIPVAESEVSEPKGSKKRLSQGSLRHRMAQLGGGLIPKVRKRLSSLSL